MQDDVLATGEKDAPLWSADSIQMVFHFGGNNNGRSPLPTVETDMTKSRVIQYVVTNREGKNTVRRFNSTFPSLPSDSEATGIYATVTHEGNNTLYNLKIPWAMLGLLQPPSKGQSFGFNFAVNDVDSDPKKRHGFEIAPGIVEKKDPAGFPTVLLQ